MTTKQRETIENALRTLEREGVDGTLVKPIWRDLTCRIEAYETGTPEDVDRQYSVPSVPPDIAAHLTGGDRLPVELAPHRMWKGYHYTLTAGQRRWFREFTGMTPGKTVTLSWVEVWKDTLHPRSFKVETDEHVDPRRKHIIKEMIVREAGKFFSQCAAFDAEEPGVKTLSVIVGPCKVWNACHRWAVEDLVGVKLKGEVGIAMCDEVAIQFVDVDGRQATVARAEFLGTVADYQYLHADDKKARVRGTTKPTAATKQYASVEDLMAELSITL